MDVAALDPEQLRIYAAGYTDALKENQLDELRATAAQIATQLAQMQAVADQIYHDAYCGCHKTVTELVTRAIDIESVRTSRRR